MSAAVDAKSAGSCNEGEEEDLPGGVPVCISAMGGTLPCEPATGTSKQRQRPTPGTEVLNVSIGAESG